MVEAEGRDLGEEHEPRPPSVWSYVLVLLRHRVMVLGIPLTAALVAAVLSLRSPREYVAPVSFVPQDPATAAPGVGQLASQLGLTTARPATSSVQFYMDLLSSREVLRDVLLTEYAIQRPAPFRGTLLRYLGLDGVDTSAAVLLGVRSLRGIVSVAGDRTTGVVRFEVRTRSPDLSADVARRLVELVNDYNLRRRQSQARAEREFVEQRLALAEAAELAAEEVLGGFYRRNRSFADSPELRAEEGRLQRQIALRQQLYLSLAQSHEAAKIEEVRNTPVITVIEHADGFVEPQARGTSRKTAVAGILGLFFSSVLAFGIEYLRKSRVAASDEYREFVRLSREVFGRWGRRTPSESGEA